MAGRDSPKSRAQKIRDRATSAAQDQTHLSRHFAMLEAELGNRTSGDLLYADDVAPRSSYAGLLFLMLLAFTGTLAFFAYQNGRFDDWLGNDGAIVQRPKAWIKANDYKIIYVPVPAQNATTNAGDDDVADSDSRDDVPSAPPAATEAPGPAPMPDAVPAAAP